MPSGEFGQPFDEDPNAAFWRQLLGPQGNNPPYDPMNPPWRYGLGGGRPPMTHGIPKSLPYGNQTPLQLPGARSPMTAGSNLNGPSGPLAAPGGGGGAPPAGFVGDDSMSLGPENGPEIIPPGRQPIRPGMSVGPRTNAATDAQTIDPAALAGATPPPWWLQAMLAGGPLKAAVSTALAPTPTARDAAPTNLPQQRPSYAGPLAAPESPLSSSFPTGLPPAAAGSPPLPPAAAVPVKRDTSRPSPTPKAKPIPAVVAQRPDLGFTTLDAPNYAPGARNRPQITALDLSKLFGGAAS